MELQIKVAQAVRVATSILTSDHHHNHHHHHHQPFLNDFEVEFFATQILKRKGANDWEMEELMNLLGQGMMPRTDVHTCSFRCTLINFQFFSAILQIQNEGYYLQLGAKDALLNALLVATKRFSSGPSQFVLRTPMVLEFLLQQSKKRLDAGIQAHERNKKILHCLLSWVRAGCFSEIPPSSLPTHPLFCVQLFAGNLSNYYHWLSEVSLSFDLAIEVLVELVSRHEKLVVPCLVFCEFYGGDNWCRSGNGSRIGLEGVL
ncbi:hypothetical protein LOK49_LG01G00002 [Camellia lanceoleosa]|uniref:Uncharacterized protein n=1 Tax=Camellia lanceoleosa TaxID=1840588 RepID=A0ACC0IY74_9ERIC|nr:hypothetical protein LOK49_LG01G00002 [Camellia lanceoleosa]